MTKNSSGIEITSKEEFQGVIDSLKASYEKIKDIIGKEKNNVERINKTEVWTGEAADAVYYKYSTLNTNYDQIEYSLELYIKFLQKTLEDYTLLQQEQEKNINAMSGSLNVNS